MYATEQAVLNSQWNAAQESWGAASDRRRPSVLFTPRLSIDGNQWCALYGENLQDGVAGFGDSPDETMKDFDKEWNKSLSTRKGKSDAYNRKNACRPRRRRS